MENCPYLDGCLERKFDGVSSGCYNVNYALRRCYRFEKIVDVFAEEWKRDCMEARVCEFN